MTVRIVLIAEPSAAGPILIVRPVREANAPSAHPDSWVLTVDAGYPLNCSYHSTSGMVIAIALTSQEPTVGYPLALEVRTGSLPKRSWAISQIRTLSTERLGNLLGQLSAEELQLVIEGLNEIIGN